jgi:hypothetical protein
MRYVLSALTTAAYGQRAAQAMSSASVVQVCSAGVGARPVRALIVSCASALAAFVSMSGSAGQSSELVPNGHRVGHAADDALTGTTTHLSSLAPSAVQKWTGASPFTLPGGLNSTSRAQTCLAQAIYYEAGSEGTDGQRAVAQVVLNRVRHPLFPNTICGVVFQGASRDTGCQFTFTCDGSLRRQPSTRGWKHAWAIAGEALNGSVFPKVGYATHYHASWMLPYWASSVDRIAVVGGHIFYTWKGLLGQGGSFRQAYAGYEPSENFAVVSDQAKSVIIPVEGPESIASVAATPAKLDEGAADKLDRFGLLDFRNRSFESPAASADAREVDQALSNAFTR